MTITNLNVVYPPLDPVEYTSNTAIEVYGGVFSDNLASVVIVNRSIEPITPYFADLQDLGGGEWFWTRSGVPVVSIGLNEIEVTAYDTLSGSALVVTTIYVDFDPPYLVSSDPEDVEVGYPVNGVLTLTFNEGMNILATAAAITLNPPVAGGQWVAGATDKILQYQYSGYLPPLTPHTITISTDAMDKQNNHLVAPIVIHFTTGLSVGVHDPTRRGLTPAQEIRNYAGFVAQPDVIAEQTMEMFANPANLNNYLYTHYTFMEKGRLGRTREIDVPYETGSGFEINPPQLINPFRSKPYVGQTMPQIDVLTAEAEHACGGQVQTVIPSQQYLHTLYGLRQKSLVGRVIDVTMLERLHYIPVILAYTFPNEPHPGDPVHHLSNHKVEMVWDNPSDDDGGRLYYRVEISKYPSFHRPFVFDSYVSSDGFYTSSDGINFVPYVSGGIVAGVGKSKFLCPVDFASGLWYVRLLVGNEVR
jgi:hypothetical protein